MPNTNIYVNTTESIINSSSANVQRYPVVLSTNAYQSLSAVLLQYQSGDDLLAFYLAQSMQAYTILNNAFSQTYATTYIGGVDLETTYTIAFSADFSTTQPFTITWLNADSDPATYTVLNGTANNLAALVSYINTNITTVTATIDGNDLTITPDTETPNQLVRISFSDLSYSDYIFTGAGVPADIPTTLNALITVVPTMSINYYGFYVSGSLFYPLVADSNSTKITNTIAVATAIEATNDYGDNQKVVFFDSADTNNATSSTLSLSYQLKNDFGYLRSATALDTFETGLQLGVADSAFALTNGNLIPPFNPLLNYSAGGYTTAQAEQMLDLTTEGITETCNNCNYFDSAGPEGPFYYGAAVTASGNQMGDIILGDNVGLEIRLQILSMFQSVASTGYTVPQSQAGLNLITNAILTVMNQFLAAGYTQAYDETGASCAISGGSYNSAGVAYGFSVAFKPAGAIQKVYVVLYEYITSSTGTTNNILQTMVRNPQKLKYKGVKLADANLLKNFNTTLKNSWRRKNVNKHRAILHR